MTLRAQVATKEAFRLGEGPVWDAVCGRLLWVDILGGEVLEGRLSGGAIEVTARHAFAEMVGAVTCTEKGTLLVAAQERLVAILPTGARVAGPRVVPIGEARRCNDGSTDPAGRFLVGTLSLDGASEREVLVRLEEDGTMSTLDGDLTLSNGLAWSVDGQRMFSVDTLRQVVFVRDYDPATGAVGERRVHVRLTKGYPDGIAMDAEDHLWVAVWGQGEVHRYTPDGSLADRVTVPAPHTSCVTFAGPGLDVLVISTATNELTPEQLERFPLSGRLFSLPAPVPGVPIPLWRPTTTFSSD